MTAGLRTRDALLGAFLASVSGLAILAHVYWDMPMGLTVPFLVVPAGVILGAAILHRSSRHRRLAVFGDRVFIGAVSGFVASLAYDATRVLIVVLTPMQFNPFLSHGIFGELITGRARDTLLAQVAGWTYHFYNGATFGVMFSMLRPSGGVWWGLGWGLVLEWIMFLVYPAFLAVRVANPPFLATSMAGHGAWGLTLGWMTAKAHAPPAWWPSWLPRRSADV